MHDSQPAAELIQGDEKAVYGDKAYASQALRGKLAEAGIDDRVMYRAARNKPLKPWQTWFNKAVAVIRHEASLRLPPGPLHRADPQRLPSAPVVHRHQPQARLGARQMTPGIRRKDEKREENSMG